MGDNGPGLLTNILSHAQDEGGAERLFWMGKCFHGFRESRKRWMLSRPASKGTVIVDAGAAKALEAKHVSLLPVGIVDVKGDFQRGDVIFVETSAGKTVACGIANYSASDARALRGLRSDRIQEKLGYEYGEEVVHRNNLVLL